MTTLYWHDYETWGEHSALDRPSQFAGVRTDEDFNVIGEPLVIYCKPTMDAIPKPDACLVTGLTPQVALREGLNEKDFIELIQREFMVPNTCVLGYNSLRFDDEVTRNTLYRNFYDPYEREWKNGNSRWDIIDMVRLMYALRPDGIQWPLREDGTPSFRLEELTAANGIQHESAHDALSDVYATIAMAKLVRDRQPKLYQHVFELRRKQEVLKLIDLHNKKPLLHISSKYPAAKCCAALVIPLMRHPVNSNGIIVADLSQNPEAFIHLSVEEIRQRLYTPTSELVEGVERPALKTVHVNKCPILVTPKLLDQQAAERLGIDRAQCETHWQTLRQWDAVSKLTEVFSQHDFPEHADPELKIYSGFIGDEDKTTMAQVRSASGEELARYSYSFHDKRLPELLFRYRARNFPDTLTDAEQLQWREYCWQKLTEGLPVKGSINIDNYHQRMAELQEQELTPLQVSVLEALDQYVEGLMAQCEP